MLCGCNITVGNPSNEYMITGRVLHGGLPVEGARVDRVTILSTGVAHFSGIDAQDGFAYNFAP